MRSTVTSVPPRNTVAPISQSRNSRAFGLVNGYGEQSCFLNVVLQALWNIESVREPLMAFVRLVDKNDPPFIAEFKVCPPIFFYL